MLKSAFLRFRRNYSVFSTFAGECARLRLPAGSVHDAMRLQSPGSDRVSFRKERRPRSLDGLKPTNGRYLAGPRRKSPVCDFFHVRVCRRAGVQAGMRAIGRIRIATSIASASRHRSGRSRWGIAADDAPADLAKTGRRPYMPEADGIKGGAHAPLTGPRLSGRSK